MSEMTGEATAAASGLLKSAVTLSAGDVAASAGGSSTPLVTPSSDSGSGFGRAAGSAPEAGVTPFLHLRINSLIKALHL